SFAKFVRCAADVAQPPSAVKALCAENRVATYYSEKSSIDRAIRNVFYPPSRSVRSRACRAAVAAPVFRARWSPGHRSSRLRVSARTTSDGGSGGASAEREAPLDRRSRYWNREDTGVS